MSTYSPSYQLSDRDLDEWVALDLITAAQRERIYTHLQTHGTSQMAPPPPKRGLDLVTISYYFGGFMILLAYTIFLGIQWESMGAAGQTVTTVFTMSVLVGTGTLLRQRNFTLPGNLLIFAATGIVPLLIYCLQNLFGLWPENSYDYEDFYRRIAPLWLTMELISIAVATAVWWFTRFPLHMLLISFWTWFFSMDFVRWVSDSDSWSWSTEEQLISVLIGMAMLLVGIALQKRDYDRDSFWLYLFGHIIVLGHLSALTLDQEGWLGLIFILVYLAFVVASVWLQRRVFLVFGAMGTYGYLCYLAFDIFDGALGFTFGLAAVGFVIILTAVGFQRYVSDWLEEVLQPYQLDA